MSSKQPSNNNGGGGKSNNNISGSAGGGESNYGTVKDGGWSSQPNFMQSYGLKPHSQDDVRESNAILDGFREAGKKGHGGSGGKGSSKKSNR